MEGIYSEDNVFFWHEKSFVRGEGGRLDILRLQREFVADDSV